MHRKPANRKSLLRKAILRIDGEVLIPIHRSLNPQNWIRETCATKLSFILLNFLAQGFEGGRDLGELFTVEADRLRLLEAVAGEIAAG